MLAVTISSTAMAGSRPPDWHTWTLNTAKSKWDPVPIPKSQIITIWREGDCAVLKVEGTDSSSKPVVPSLTRYKEDGEADNGTATTTVRKISITNHTWWKRVQILPPG